MAKSTTLFATTYASQPTTINRKALERSIGRKSGQNYTDWLTAFQHLNREVFQWLDTSVAVDNLSLRLYPGDKLIGVIPTRLPPTGLQGGDFILLPKRIISSKQRGNADGSGDADDSDNDGVSNTLQALQNVYDIANLIGESLEIEFYDGPDLRSHGLYRPPLYHQALRTMQAYADALNSGWRRFVSVRKTLDHPIASTDWNSYARKSYDPHNMLRYEATVNELTANHREWQQLTMVYQHALSTVEGSVASASIKRQCQRLRDKVSSTINMPHNPTASTSAAVCANYLPRQFVVRNSEPLSIRIAKTEANLYLSEQFCINKGWRLDLSVLFERYVQYLFERALKATPWNVCKNDHYPGHGFQPKWGITYLEPDIQLVNNVSHAIIPIDVKYKNHLAYGAARQNDVLKKTFRSDLHQIIAYSSFTPYGDFGASTGSKHRTCMLVYPTAELEHRDMSYDNSHSGISVTVHLVGVPFDHNTMPHTIAYLKKLICDNTSETI